MVKGAVVVERMSTPYPSPYPAPSPSDMGSQNTDIYDGLGLLALGRVAVAQRRVYFISISFCIVFTNAYSSCL